VTESGPAFVVSTQTMPRQLSDPKSAIDPAFPVHGFQTTVDFDPDFAMTMRRSFPGS
jgi:hypothetical protein